LGIGSISNVTDAFGILVVAGLETRATLAALTDTDLSNAAFRRLSAQEISLAGIPVRAQRVTFVGELGWELHAPMADLTRLYTAILAAGEPNGIADPGSQAVNSLRTEKSHRGYGSELTN
jgi:dimethylglycine dehydrogenase